jgi:hypothetical protein
MFKRFFKKTKPVELTDEQIFANFLSRSMYSTDLVEWNGVWTPERLHADDVLILFFLKRDVTPEDHVYRFTEFKICETIIEISKIPTIPPTPGFNFILSVFDSLIYQNNTEIDTNTFEKGVCVKLSKADSSKSPTLVSLEFVRRTLGDQFNSWLLQYARGSYKTLGKVKPNGH